MEPVVNLEKVNFNYGNTPVLRDVCFQVNDGEFIGIIGPNGGGKTTLLKLILGFQRPTSGKIEVFGCAPSVSASQLAYVPQSLRFDRQFPISVIELVLSGRISRLPWYGRFSVQDRKAAEQSLERVGLQDMAGRAFGTLSGGQMQRALIARALVSEPKLLLLDEPTASVDSQAEADIYRILNELRGQMTILIVTHDLRTAIDQVDRVLCVQGTVLSLLPEQVCEHFALGLYHSPLILGKQAT